jgi:coenzyme F420 hydrogenase subunit delta
MPDWAHPHYLDARCLVLGCGNVLYGDDGFGPAVAERLATEGTPQGVVVLDVGTGARKVLFNLLLAESVPRLVIVADAVNRGRGPGEVFWMDLGDLPVEKVDDFSMHQAPTSNLLAELRDRCGVSVEVLACQSAWIPTEIATGLSPEVSSAVGSACRLIRRRFGGD